MSPAQMKTAAISVDGARLAAVDYRRGTAIVMDWGNPEPKMLLESQPLMTSIALSPDGKWISTSTWKGVGVKIWDASTGTYVCDLPEELSSAKVGFSPDSRWLATSHEDAYQIWEVGKWNLIQRIPRDQAGMLGPIVFSPDGRMVALALSNSTLKLLDTASWQEIATLVPPDSEVFEALCFSPDGGRLAVSARGVLQIWDLKGIRGELAKSRLDWDLPHYPEPTADRIEKPAPLTIELLEDERD
jgi:WD40 repeat protein